jgi:hypothetical protein
MGSWSRLHPKFVQSLMQRRPGCINIVPNYRRHNLLVVFQQDPENLDTTAGQYGIEHCSISISALDQGNKAP